jgi:hypothetical protein
MLRKNARGARAITVNGQIDTSSAATKKGRAVTSLCFIDLAGRLSSITKNRDSTRTVVARIQGDNAQNHNIVVPGIPVGVVDQGVEHVKDYCPQTQKCAGSRRGLENVTVYADDAQNHKYVAHT